MLHSGLDCHKRTLAIATIDAEGRPVRDVQLPTKREASIADFAALPGGPAAQRAVVESTSNWYWLRDLLASQRTDLRLAHSTPVKAISDATVKTDAVDAATLAQLLRGDLVPEPHMATPEWREARDLLRARLQLVSQQVRVKNTITGLLAQYHVTAPSALPPLVQLRVQLLLTQATLRGEQARQLAAELNPVLIPTPDVQRLLWIPGIGRVVAFTIWLEAGGIQRFPGARDVVSDCRLVPGAGNSGGKTRHKRTKDGNRYLTLAVSHAAVRAVPYVPEIRAFSQRLCRRQPPVVARAVVAKELARIAYDVLTTQEAFNGTCKGKSLSRTKQPKWPRLASPAVSLEPAPRSRASPPPLIGRQAACRRLTAGTSPRAASPYWCMAATEASGRDRPEVTTGTAAGTAAVHRTLARGRRTPLPLGVACPLASKPSNGIRAPLAPTQGAEWFPELVADYGTTHSPASPRARRRRSTGTPAEASETGVLRSTSAPSRSVPPHARRARVGRSPGSPRATPRLLPPRQTADPRARDGRARSKPSAPGRSPSRR
jgi:transposase